MSGNNIPYLGWPPKRVVPPNPDMQYPKWIVPPGGTKRIVQTEAEEIALMGVSLKPMEPAILEGTPTTFIAEPEAVLDAERDQLIRYCVETKIAIDKRWGITKIKEAIANHKPL